MRQSDILDAVRAAQTVAELSALWQQNAAAIGQNANLKDAFTRRKNEIQNNA